MLRSDFVGRAAAQVAFPHHLAKGIPHEFMAEVSFAFEDHATQFPCFAQLETGVLSNVCGHRNRCRVSLHVVVEIVGALADATDAAKPAVEESVEVAGGDATEGLVVDFTLRDSSANVVLELVTEPAVEDVIRLGHRPNFGLAETTREEPTASFGDSGHILESKCRILREMDAVHR